MESVGYCSTPTSTTGAALPWMYWATLEALQATNWRVSGVHGAAALLGMHPEKLRYRMQKYGLRRPKQ